jgi:protein subunit release factor A
MHKNGSIKIYFYRSRGPGGQRKNRKATAVKIVHIPTGITVRATEYRSQYQNKQLALQRLEKRIALLKQVKKKRIPTRKPGYVRRLEAREKKIRGEKKQARRKITDYDNGSDNA